MEFEQIEKRLEWLDEQQRKQKTTLGDLTDKLTSLETSVNVLTQQFKTFNKELSDLSPATARINQFDEMMAKQRTDLNKLVEAMEKGAVRREQDASKLVHAELQELNKKFIKLSEAVNIDVINKKFTDRTHEEKRLMLAVQDMRASVDATVSQSKDLVLTQKAMEESQRQNSKHLADLQGEMASVRKRADEAREKTILYGDGIRNMENRVNELFGAEKSREEEQAAFLAQQSLAQVERDKAWKDWQGKYGTFKQQAETMEMQVAALDESIRAAKRAQESYNDLNQKLERRIAEVGEMQRLAEDRIRQEWVAFKAEEQKRWTGHSLSQEEAMRDLRKDMDKLEGRLTQLDDSAQTMQDQLHQTTDTTEQQLQELMNVAHDWLTAYERIMGHAKTKAKKASR